jgi:hypothetical protein
MRARTARQLVFYDARGGEASLPEFVTGVLALHERLSGRRRAALVGGGAERAAGVHGSQAHRSADQQLDFLQRPAPVGSKARLALLRRGKQIRLRPANRSSMSRAKASWWKGPGKARSRVLKEPAQLVLGQLIGPTFRVKIRN